MSPSDASRLSAVFRDLPVPGPFGIPPQPDPSTWATACSLPLRSDFPPEAVALRSAAIAHSTHAVESLTALRPLVERSDDREAVGDALDSLRGVLLALRDVGTDDPRADDDPDGETDPVVAAAREGLSVHSATLHVGGTVEFLAHSWEEGGFHVRADGEPRCDARGNTVARHSVEPIDPQSAAHRDLCVEWFNGD